VIDSGRTISDVTRELGIDAERHLADGDLAAAAHRAHDARVDLAIVAMLVDAISDADTAAAVRSRSSPTCPRHGLRPAH
jgi:hypothetical protein